MEAAKDLNPVTIEIPEPCLLLLIGPSGAGKSTFARRHFATTEILSSDFCRALVSDDESNQEASADAFELLHLILDKRLKRRRTTVVDATNVLPSSRAVLLKIATARSIPAAAVVFLLPDEICQIRNRQRTCRQVPCEVIRSQRADLEASMDALSEGFERVFKFHTPDEANGAIVVRRVYS
jgi:protein phosphatase